jgi:phenylalanyl-tRNA synthetase beta chain
MLGTRCVGLIGELHPRLQQKLELPLAPVVFEIDADSLQGRQLPAYHEISKFPAVTRDLALLVKQSVSVQSLIDTFNAQRHDHPACKIMQDIVLFDEYRGKGLAEDQKSLAFRITMQDTQSTLQDDSVDAAMSAFIELVNIKHGAALRK